MMKSKALLVVVASSLLAGSFHYGVCSERHPVEGDWIGDQPGSILGMDLEIKVERNPADRTHHDLSMLFKEWRGASFAPGASHGGNVHVEWVSGRVCDYQLSLTRDESSLYFRSRSRDCFDMKFSRK